MLLVLGAVLEDLFKFSEMTLSLLMRANKLESAVLSRHSLYTLVLYFRNVFTLYIYFHVYNIPPHCMF